MIDSPIEITNFQSEIITHDNNNLVIEFTRNIAFAAESMNGEEKKGSKRKKKYQRESFFMKDLDTILWVKYEIFVDVKREYKSGVHVNYDIIDHR